MADFYGDTRGIPLTPFIFDKIYENITPLASDEVAVGRYILYKDTASVVPRDIVYQKIIGTGLFQVGNLAYKEITQLNSAFKGEVEQTLEEAQTLAETAQANVESRAAAALNSAQTYANNAKTAAINAQNFEREAANAVAAIEGDSLNFAFSQSSKNNAVGLTANFIKEDAEIGETIDITSKNLQLSLDATTDPKTMYIDIVWETF